MLEKELQDSKAYICDVANIEKLQDICKQVKLDLGAPEILIHNAVKGNFEKPLDGKPEWLEENFRINTTSLMYLAHCLIPDMIKKKRCYYSYWEYCGKKRNCKYSLLCSN